MDMIKGPMIGEGSFKRVYAGQDSKKIYAEMKATNDPLQMKAFYYLWKIGHLLFPDNLPDIHAAGVKNRSYFRAQRMEVGPLHEEAQRTHTPGKMTSNAIFFKHANEAWAVGKDEEIGQLLTKMKQAGLPGFEISIGNVSRVPSGAIHILDLRDPWSKDSLTEYHKYFDSSALAASIQVLPLEQKRKAKFYLKRLENLYREATA